MQVNNPKDWLHLAFWLVLFAVILLLVQGATYEPSPWPGGVIPYEFDSGVNATQRQAALDAMAEWETRINVDFRPRSAEANYIYFEDSFQNAAPVGFYPGKHTVHIYNWNSPKVPANNSHVIVHELGHVLGLYHEHRRTDRDTYIQVLWSQIEPGRTADFQLVPAPATAHGPYDFDSLMHGNQCNETHCAYCPLGDPTAMDTCRTLVVLPPNDTAWQWNIGQLNHISVLDSLVLHFLYKETDWVFVEGSYPGLNEFGTFLEPFKQFDSGVSAVPTGGTIWVQPGTYGVSGTYAKESTIRAPWGGVTLGGP